jgi:acetolactate synthase-1/2/3 large subunit
MQLTRSLSQVLVDMIREQGCKTVFGVPGAYSIHFVDTCAVEGSPIDFVLSSHEGGATFMAQGYSQVTRSLGCVVTTAGPAALNTVAALASAKCDGDRVLLVHGEIPKAKRREGLLQDATAFGCDIQDVLAPVVHDQFIIDSASDFTDQFDRLSEALEAPSRTTHLMVGADVFSAPVSLPFPREDFRAAEENADSNEVFASIEDRLIECESVFALIGHGVYQANCIEDLQAFLDPLEIPTMVTARAAACIDSKRPYYLGQHSIFSHRRVDDLLKTYGGRKTSLLLVIGSSLGEFATNGAASYLREIPNIVHVNTDEKCFGRLGKHALNLKMDAKLFITRLMDSPRLARSRAAIRERNRARMNEFRATTSMELYSRLDEDLSARNGELTGQRLVHAVSKALDECLDPVTTLNVVADTGSSKLYAAHYFSFRSGSRCIMNSGSIDCLGFGLSAAIGAAVGSRDIQENAVTVCFVGDGGILMNNELNTLAANASLRGLKLLVFILNDGSLSYVHQGFAAVMGRPLASTRFDRQLDFAKMAASFGLPSVTVENESAITPEFFTAMLEKEEFPLIIDCRISNKVVGPGLSRYNQVRALLGKKALSPAEMRATLE